MSFPQFGGVGDLFRLIQIRGAVQNASDGLTFRLGIIQFHPDGLRPLPERRQLLGLTYTSIVAMPECHATGGSRTNSPVHSGKSLPLERAGRAEIHSAGRRLAFTEPPDKAAPLVSESTGEVLSVQAEDDDECEPTPEAVEHSPSAVSRRRPAPFESLHSAHLSPVHQTVIATGCRRSGWPDYSTHTEPLPQSPRQGPDGVGW
jgi:hypothetical protein